MFNFQWAIPAGGFRWADRQLYDAEPSARPGRYVVPVAAGPHARVYDPFEQSALFKTFGSVEPTETGILEFAGKFGLLGGTYTHRLREPDPGGQPNVFWPGVGETRQDWAAEIGLMAHVIDLLDAYRSADAVRLREHIHWEQIRDGYRVLYTTPAIAGWKRQSTLIAAYPASALATVQVGDLIGPAWTAILSVANAQLERHPLHAALVDRGGGAAALTLPPASLVGALWLQAARSIADSPVIQRCAACGEYFQITGGKRVDSIYCSPGCRLRAHRAKARAARSPGRKAK